MVQNRFNFGEGQVELYAERIDVRGLCAQTQAESLRYVVRVFRCPMVVPDVRAWCGFAVPVVPSVVATRLCIPAGLAPRSRVATCVLAEVSCVSPPPFCVCGCFAGVVMCDWASCSVKLLAMLPARRASYAILKFVMESGAKGCEIVISGKLRGQRAKAAKFRDGYMVKSGNTSRGA